MSDIFEETTGDQNTDAPEQTQTAPETQQEPAQESHPEGYVPQQALNESRARLRQAENELNDLKGKFGDLEAMREQFQEWNQQKNTTEAFNEDPLGEMYRQLNDLKEKFESGRTEDQEAQQRAAQDAQVQQMVANQVQEFRKEHPDYDLALKHVMDQRAQELAAMGRTQEQINIELANDAGAIAQSALQEGINPAQKVYDLAKMRGWAGETQPKKDQIDNIAEGQQAAQTLSGSGESDGGTVDPSKLPPDQFDKWWNDNITSNTDYH